MASSLEVDVEGIPPPPPLVPAPAAMEEGLTVGSGFTTGNALGGSPLSDSSLNPAVITGLQMMTRKRSSQTNSQSSPGGPVSPNVVESETNKSTNVVPARDFAVPPPKKKKKTSSKSKKPMDLNCTNAAASAVSKPKAKKSSKSKSKKAATFASLPTPVTSSESQMLPVFGERLAAQSITMPKLMRMPQAELNVGGLAMVSETPLNGECPAELHEKSGSSRKKKSKGRNGNIYIGVENRIKWLHLQNMFGFGSVNNFGTFVLQTMRRVYGDVQFWCDVATASGQYADLDHYEWTNGFPQAVNKEGNRFTPVINNELESDPEKREEIVEMIDGMWNQRLQQLKQELSGGEPVNAIVEDGDDGDHEDEGVPALDMLFENKAATNEMTEEEVNLLYSEHVENAENGQEFQSIRSMIESLQGQIDDLEAGDKQDLNEESEHVSVKHVKSQET